MTPVDVRWKGGGTARLVSIGGDAVALRSSVPSPPGARIEGIVDAAGGIALRVKVHACRREVGGADYVVEGRPLDLPRPHRERLEALVRAGSAPA